MEVIQQDNQYIIKIPVNSVDALVLKKLLRELQLQELLAQRKGTTEDADMLAHSVNEAWWEANKQRFLNEDTGR